MTPRRWYVMAGKGEGLGDLARHQLPRAAERLRADVGAVICNPGDLAEMQAAGLGLRIEARQYVMRRGLMLQEGAPCETPA